MAFSSFALLLIGCLSFYLAHGSPPNAQVKLADDELKTLSFKQMMNCLPDDQISVYNDCADDIFMKIQAINPTIMEQNNDDEEARFEIVFSQLESECVHAKFNVFDMESRKLDLSLNAFAEKYISASSLSPEEQLSAHSAMKTCLLENVKDPSAPVYMKHVRISPIAGEGLSKEPKQHEQEISPAYVGSCLAIGLIANGCDKNSLSELRIKNLLEEFRQLNQYMKELDQATSS